MRRQHDEQVGQERSGMRGTGRDEKGTSLVEFALILPVFALLLFAMIDFGLAFSGYVTLRGGIQSGARLAAVDQYTTFTGTCTGGPNAATADMVCTTAARIGSLVGVSTSSLSIGICFPGAGSCSTQSTTGSVNSDVEVCAQAPLHATTGITAPFLNGKVVSTSSLLRLEQGNSGGTTDFSTFNASSAAVVYAGKTITGMNCS